MVRSKAPDSDIQAIAVDMGIDPAEIERRKNYLQLTEEDVVVLRELRAAVEPVHGRVMDHFYQHLMGTEETRSFFEKPVTLAQLKEAQRRYFLELTGGNYDWNYFFSRLRVGVVHQKIHLTPLLYVGAFSNYLCRLLPEIFRIYRDDTGRALRAIQALIKIIFLDIELVLDTYMHADRKAICRLKEYAENIVRSVPAGLMVLSSNQVVLSANQSMEQVAGERHDLLKGRDVEAIIPGIGMRDRINEVLTTGRAQHGIVFEKRDKRGHRRSFRIGVVPMVSEENAVADARVLLVIEDLTEVERLNLETQSADARIRAIMDNVADGIITINTDGIIESFNGTAESLFGYSAVEVIGKNIKMLMPEPYRSQHNGYLKRYLESGERHCLGVGFREVEGQRKDGVVFPMDLSISEMIQGDKRLFIGIVRDITERKKTQQMTLKLSRALEQADDSIMITTHDGVVEYVNKGFERTTGYQRKEIIGKKPSLLKSGMMDDSFYQRLWETLISGEGFHDVFVNRRKDGSIYYEQKNINPVRDEKGVITHFVSAGRDITQYKEVQDRMHYLANHDILTGLANRILLTDRLNHAIGRGRRVTRKLAVLFLDLDRFKTVNETLGHELGDRVLREVAERLKSRVRDGDTVARVGSDEYAILLDDLASLDDVPHVVNKIFDVFNSPLSLEGRELFVTASIGIAVFPHDGENGEVLLRNAATATRQAKRGGSNSYQFYTRDMNEKAGDRLAMEAKLRRALQRDEFLLHFQPQIDLKTGRVFGMEALLRWDAEWGLVSPAEFVPILEETGMIVPVGEWVLQTACEQFRKWQEKGLPQCRIAVNLSGHQVNNPDFMQFVEKVLRQTGMAPDCLELEITESVIMSDVQQAEDMLEALKSMNVKLAVDDFGTGYSSLAYLKRFPLSTLKIDRSFINNLATNREDASIVDAIISLAHALNLSVVAEGVETKEQLRHLSDKRCEAAQGYLFSRPLPVRDIEKLLTETDAFPI